MSSGSNRALPPAQRFLTVPDAQPRIASSTEYPSVSTSTKVARWSAFRVLNASATTLRYSFIAAGSVINVVPIRVQRSRFSRNGSVSRDLMVRSRSRQALTTMRCSQVVTRASPR